MVRGVETQIPFSVIVGCPARIKNPERQARTLFDMASYNPENAMQSLLNKKGSLLTYEQI